MYFFLKTKLTIDIEYNSLADGWRDVIGGNAEEGAHLPPVHAPQGQGAAHVALHWEQGKFSDVVKLIFLVSTILDFKPSDDNSNEHDDKIEIV